MLAPYSTTNISLNDLADTENLALNLLPFLTKGTVVCLYGDLGSGKTTLSQYLIKYLSGIENATSPTFTIVQTYPSNNYQIFHYDLYRLKSPEEIFEIGLLDNFEQAVSLIEWPEIAENYLPLQQRIDIKLSFVNSERSASVKLY